ncbi:MAG: hypothetical protein LUQ17_03865, partial [Methanomicrobiales archaeon]|nr:hypothetical protein [Methanomicrobiales archaeon]
SIRILLVRMKNKDIYLQKETGITTAWLKVEHIKLEDVFHMTLTISHSKRNNMTSLTRMSYPSENSHDTAITG